jgi:hypothetical protein
MQRTKIATAVLMAACGVGLVSWNLAWGREDASTAGKPLPATQPALPLTPVSGQRPPQPVEAKELSNHVIKGLGWLAARQLPDGGWGQGEDSSRMNAPQQQDSANVADTCMAALALVRSGSTPMQGEYASNIRSAVLFVCGQVEKSDENSLFVTDIRGTRVQSKLGTYVDTFLAALLLAEVKGQMPEEADNQRVLAMLTKTLGKIDRNQQQDGAWANEGWAPALAQGLASKSVNRAAQLGGPVNEEMRKRAERYAQGNFDKVSGSVVATGSAGIPLYAVAANVQSIKDSDDTNQIRKLELEQAMEAPATPPQERAAAERELSEIRANQQILAETTQNLVRQLGDKTFVAGFGSNGGEEFLSYMHIGEALLARGGEDWQKWDESMSGNLNRIQNDDGSWSGHHCITGKTFCTSAALMVLMVDRSTVPLAAEIKK